MHTHLRFAFALALAATAPLLAQEAKTVLNNAAKALGDVKTIQYSGSGVQCFFGQALTAGKEWPRRNLTSYTRSINYDQKSSMEDYTFAQPVFGGQRQNTQVNGDKSWNMNGATAAPNPAAADERQLQIWLTPHGFVKAALAAPDASAKKGKGGTVVTFKALGKYTVSGTIDAAGLVTRTETKIPNPVMGDMDVITTYSDYKDFNGIKFPAKILQTEGGFPVWDLTITAVQPNAPANLPVPANVQSAAVPPVTVASAKIADGVWFLGGGSHHSLVVEFDKYIAVIEGPLNEERSLAVIAEAKKLVPNKPIKYVLTTHHHFDHSGGLRTYVAEGATVVTHYTNKPYFEKTFKAPATLAPDEQAKSPKKATIIPVKDKYVLTDGKQTIEVYPTVGDQHSDELSVLYLPGAKILVEADSFSPGPPNAPAPSPVPPNAQVLYDNIQRLKLEPTTIVGIHGRGPVPYAEFLKFVGK